MSAQTQTSKRVWLNLEGKNRTSESILQNRGRKKEGTTSNKPGVAISTQYSSKYKLVIVVGNLYKDSYLVFLQKRNRAQTLVILKGQRSRVRN